ncbi:MAG: PEGA domain-containing protein [Patescibacteria group bacterium]
MTHFRRRLLFWSFFTSFFIIAPVLIFFALGYRYSTQRNAILKTGTLIASSLPRDAIVSIDGERVNGTTPLTARAITPGIYTVRFEKDGYLPWQKRLTVDANKATFAADIHLFPDTAAEAATEPAEFLSLAPTGDRALGVWLTNEKEELRFLALDVFPVAATPLVTPESRIATIAWRNDGQAALLTDTKGKSYLFDSTSPPLRLQALPAHSVESRLTWSPDGTMLLIEPSKVSVYSTTGSGRVLTSSNTPWRISDAARLPNGDLYSILTDETTSTLTVQHASSQTTSTAELAATNLHFRLATEKHIMTSDAAGQTEVFRVEKSSLAKLTSVAATSGSYNPITTTYLYSSGNAIWLYSLLADTRELLLRTSTAISAIAFVPDGSAILYADAAVHALEMDGRDTRNDVVLVPDSANAATCLTTTTGNRLYCTASAETKTILLSRPL